MKLTHVEAQVLSLGREGSHTRVTWRKCSPSNKRGILGIAKVTEVTYIIDAKIAKGDTLLHLRPDR
jgi:hypothetical protein